MIDPTAPCRICHRRPDQPLTGGGRVPPNDLDSESAVLSAGLLGAARAEDIASVLSAEHFYSDSNARIFAAMLELERVGTPVDIVSVAGLLRDRELLAGVGGVAYLAQLADATPAVAHVLHHARIVRRKARLRALIATLQRASSEGYADVGDVDAWIDEVEGRIHAVTQDRADDAPAGTLRDGMIEFFRELMSERPMDPGVGVGLLAVDNLLGPVLPGELAIVAAGSGIGKSAYASQWIINTALTQVELDGAKKTQAVLLFSHEMSRKQITKRVLFSEARVDSAKANKKHKITPEEWTRIASAGKDFALTNVYIDPRSGLTTFQIKAQTRRVIAQAKRAGFVLRLVVIDYLQLVDGSLGGGRQHERREREVAFISKSLKDMAKDLNVAVVVLAQINDEARKSGRTPSKDDLRESKAVAHDADAVVLIHNPARDERRNARRHGEGSDDVGRELVDVIVAKSREGDMGTALVGFEPKYTLFSDATEDDVRRFDERQREAERNGKGKQR